MILTLLIPILISAFLIASPLQVQSQNANQTSDTIHLEEFACKAIDPKSLKFCIEQAKTINVPLVKIDAPIICTNRQDCSFGFNEINTNTIFYSTRPENKIIRREDFSYTLFLITNSSGLEFSQLIFEDEGQNPCPQATICPDIISIKNSRNITIGGTLFNKSRGAGVLISNSRDITVKGSNFFNGYQAGVKVASTIPTESIIIEGNNFEGNAGEGVIFQSLSLSDTPSSIESNTFTNNHAKGAFSDCTYPCVGSQLSIIGQTGNLNINRNKIQGGVDTVFDLLGLYASGIEIGSSNISQVKIYCNKISGNRGSGIAQSAPTQNTAPVLIDENKIWGNGLNLNIPVAKIEANNCFNKECTLACLK